MRAGLFLVFTYLFVLASAQPYILVLGTAQDGGFPHIGCQNECQLAHKNPELSRYIVSMALVDPISKQWWLFEATPDMDRQLQLFQDLTNKEYNYLPNGIFLTHAHIGHYTGLMFLGREALGAKNMKVYSLPKLGKFLESNGPWSQLVSLQNINLVTMNDGQGISLTDQVEVTAFTVPHRDEFSETAGFKITTSQKSYLFIPDINKWGKWSQSVVEMTKTVDYAFLDASFFADGELPNRSISEVPHPFVTETIALFEKEENTVKAKVHFIHFNHTNPLLFDPIKRREVRKAGFSIAEQGVKYQ